MELGEWVWGRIIENLDNKKLDNGGSTVLGKQIITYNKFPF